MLLAEKKRSPANAAPAHLILIPDRSMIAVFGPSCNFPRRGFLNARHFGQIPALEKNSAPRGAVLCFNSCPVLLRCPEFCLSAGGAPREWPGFSGAGLFRPLRGRGQRARGWAAVSGWRQRPLNMFLNVQY
jgi:hypothetical protein